MMNQIKHVRKFAIILLAVATVLTLAACGSKDKTPFGDIGDTPYLTIGDITITERQLYEELRLQGASVLATMVDEIIFKDQLTVVRTLVQDDNEDLIKFIDKTVNEAIHRTSDETALKDLFEKNQDRFNRNIETFVDSLYLLDNAVNIDEMIAAIKDLENSQDTAYSGYVSISNLVERYELRAAQRHYAKSILDEEVLDEDSNQFISEDNILNYYRQNKQDRYEVDALVIRFINLNEANAALYKLGVKSDSRGFWYQIPDVRIALGQPGYVDLSDQSPTGFGHVRTILSDLGILSKVLDDPTSLTLLEYENYYKRYVISTNRENGLRDEALTMDQVKEKFVQIYNLLNPAAQIVIAIDGTIVGAGGSTYSTTLTYDDLTKMNTSLRNHVYNTLTAADQVDPDDVTAGKPYSSRVQTFGNSRFLVFKLSDDSASEEGILIEDPEDDTKEVFADTAEAKAIRDEIFETLLTNKLTTNYIQSKVNELYEEKSLNIYDPVVRTFYEQNYGYDGATKAIDNETIAQIDGTKITVRAFYTRLEKSYGINLSLDLASNLFLMSNSDYTVSDADRKSFETQFKDIIEQFSANQFATAGYPASMGREKFLLLAFGARTNQDAINQLFIYPNLREQYIEDVNAHYDFEDYSIYEKLADLAALHHDNFKSINVSHLLIFIDANGDGSPDNPSEYLDGLTAQGRQEVLDGLVELVAIINELVGNYKGFPEALTAISNEFNNSGRIERGSRIPPIEYENEIIWAKYRQLGLNLKFENIGSAITNTSNFITGQSVLDKVFYDRAIEIQGILNAMPTDDSKFPYFDFYDTGATASDLESVKSSFGWHLILATSMAQPRSAIFSEADDEDGKYVSDNDELNVYNEDSETLTASQIKFYLEEQKTDEGVVLPSAVQSAISAYLTPVLTRYNNTFMQRELIFSLLENVSFENATNSARFNTIRAINRRQLNEYMLSPNGFFDQNYDNLYGTWFDILEATTKN